MHVSVKQSKAEEAFFIYSFLFLSHLGNRKLGRALLLVGKKKRLEPEIAKWQRRRSACSFARLPKQFARPQSLYLQSLVLHLRTACLAVCRAAEEAALARARPRWSPSSRRRNINKCWKKVVRKRELRFPHCAASFPVPFFFCLPLCVSRSRSRSRSHIDRSVVFCQSMEREE